MKVSAKKTAKKAAKAPAKRVAKRATFISFNKELDEIGTTVAFLKKNPAKGREMLVQAGIYTSTGKLTKAYGG